MLPDFLVGIFISFNILAMATVSMSYNGRNADHGTIHRFLEQVANALPELRKKS